MKALDFISRGICQDDISINFSREPIVRFMTNIRYWMTPEDSLNTVYREPISKHPEYLYSHAHLIKTIFWLLMSLFVAFLISRLR